MNIDFNEISYSYLKDNLLGIYFKALNYSDINLIR